MVQKETNLGLFFPIENSFNVLWTQVYSHFFQSPLPPPLFIFGLLNFDSLVANP